MIYTHIPTFSVDRANPIFYIQRYDDFWLFEAELRRHGSLETNTTDGLRSYRAAMAILGNTGKQEVGRWANNGVENSHLPFQRRERAMLSFRQMKYLQKFASVHANVHNHINLDRHLIDRQTYKTARTAALAEWQNLMARANSGKGRTPPTGDELRLD